MFCWILVFFFFFWSFFCLKTVLGMKWLLGVSSACIFFFFFFPVKYYHKFISLWLGDSSLRSILLTNLCALSREKQKLTET